MRRSIPGMQVPAIAVVSALALLLALPGCTPAPQDGPAPGPDDGTARPRETATTAGTSGPWKTPTTAVDSVTGTVVRFSTHSETLNVTIDEDSPATRDFLSMLPLTLTMEEFAGREKIADLPRPLRHEGSPGSDPGDGDLIYFIPWGNLGFYYNASGIEFSDQTVHLGRYDATPQELARFEGQEVHVEVVR